ncbi:MAG: VWA domain-containing protein [Planctomycetia bacterium]|nr:VWA domain-containing protein [Planctomycetia bacterium]
MPLETWSGSTLKAEIVGTAQPAAGGQTPSSPSDEIYTPTLYTADVVEESAPLPPPLPPMPPHVAARQAPAQQAAPQQTAPQLAPAQQPAAPAQAEAAAQEQAPADDAAREAPGAQVSRTLLHGFAAAASSTVFHLLLLIFLGLMMTPGINRPEIKIIEATVNERPIEEVVQRLQTDLKPATQLNAASSPATAGGGIQGVTLATAIAPPKLNTKVVDRMTSVKVDVGAANVFTTTGASFASAVPQGTLGEALTTVEGYGEAMDLLTQEILNRLARSKVLVVWVFDQSLSMKDDQKDIRERLEKVYTELGLSSTVKGDSLLTGVVSFGKDFAVHTQRPTNLMEDIRKAIDAVPVDESGEEFTCTAIGRAVAGFRQFANVGGGRQMMVVLVTDESGNQNDNISTLEPAIAVCKDAKASVYVLGREAVFGYPYAHMNWPVTIPAVGGGSITRNFVVPVERGPETPFVEMLQTEGFNKRTDAHPSGFGPYEQVRMARETGGMFMMLPTPEAAVFRRDTTVFDFEQMRPYLPDLRSRDAYAKDREYAPVHAIIWRVINDLNPYRPEIAQHINLRQGFSADRAAFAREVDVELAKAQRYVEYLNIAEKALRDARKFRDREKSPRWRAHYDLILAQLIAYKARVFEYGAYLTLFRTNPKAVDPATPSKAHGGWQMNERGKTVADKTTKPLVEESTAMLKAIMVEYAGTPWATRADFELKRGFGVDLVPTYYNPNPPPSTGGGVPVRPFTVPKI